MLNTSQFLLGSGDGCWGSIKQTASSHLYFTNVKCCLQITWFCKISHLYLTSSCAVRLTAMTFSILSAITLHWQKEKNEGTHSPRPDNICLFALHNMTCDVYGSVCCPFYEEVLWGSLHNVLHDWVGTSKARFLVHTCQWNQYEIWTRLALSLELYFAIVKPKKKSKIKKFKTRS